MDGACQHFHGSLQRPLGSWTGLQGRVPRPLSADWLAQDFKLWSQHPSIFKVPRAKVLQPTWPPGFKGCAKLSEQVSALAEPTRAYQPAQDLNSHPELPLACAYFLLQAGNYIDGGQRNYKRNERASTFFRWLLHLSCEGKSQQYTAECTVHTS